MKQQYTLIFTHTYITKGCATRKAEMNSRKKAFSDTLLLQLLPPYSCSSYSICLFVNYNGILWGSKNPYKAHPDWSLLLVKVQFFKEHPQSFYMGFDPTPLGWSYDHAVS